MHSKEFLERGPQPYGGGIDFSGKTLDEIRADMDAWTLSNMNLPEDVIWQRGNCGGADGIWIEPVQEAEHTILYFHGGGLSTGSALTSLPFAAELVHRTGYRCFTVNYRMPPSDPFPAFSDDCYYAYLGLLNRVPAEKICFCGESAGGYLVMSALQRCRISNTVFPGAAVVISGAGTPPEAIQPESGRKDADFDMPPFAVPAEKIFPPDTTDFSSPVVNPQFGSFAGFPPVMLTGGGAEKGMNDPSRDFASAMSTGLKLASAGCDVKILIGQDMEHCYPLDFAFYPEASQAVDEICYFIKKKLSIR